MKRSVLARIMALLLVFSLLPVNASAAIWDNWFNKSPQTSQSADKKAEKEAEKAAEKAKKEAEKAAEKAKKEAEKAAEKAKKEAEKAAKEAEKAAKKDNKKPGKEEKPAKPGKDEKPAKPGKEEKPAKPGKPGKPGKDEPTEPEVTEPVVSDLTVVEDATTADNGRLLRAYTYERNSGVATFAAREAESPKVVYFPVTMYDYDEDTIRAATNKIEAESGLKEKWEGFYFSGGTPGPTEYTYTTSASAHENLTWAEVQNGTYYADAACTNQVTVNQLGNAGSDYSQVTVQVEEIWNTKGTQVNVAGNDVYETNYYYYYRLTGTYCSVYIRQSETYYIVQYLNPYGGLAGVVGYGYFNATDSVTVYKSNITVAGYTLTAGGETLATLNGTDTSAQVGVTLYTAGGSVTVNKNYADWNFWNKGSGNNNNGDLIYTGLVQSEMVNDQIVFNVPEAGIFNNDTTVKNIYEYVGLPFVLDTNTGVYSFDSDAYGAYFEGTPRSGTAEEPHRLHWGSKQPMPNGLGVGDGSTNAFLPFNGAGPYDTSDVNYHFGMRADLPFSMTTNGRIKSTDDESTPISFTFSGDDDVWVFIDGHLVIDLGGIHNRLDATIDFAANTVTYSEENGWDSDNTTGSYNDSSFATTQQLFTNGNVEGIIPMTRAAFAADTDHEMQIFYLERGAGTSNARIEFNLPMHDSVLVTKDATKSWSQAGEEADLALNPKDENAGVDELTAAEQAIVNNIDFGFTLYKNGEPVRNTNFYLQGRDVTGVVINSTDANGHFYLKNGQSAKFVTEIPTAGSTYYVVEDQVPDGFISPDFTFAGEATYDYSYSGYNDGEAVSGTAPAADASQIPEQIIPMPEKDANGNFINWPVNKSYEVIVSGSIEASDSIEFICSNFMDAALPNPTALTQEDIIVIDYGLPVKISPLANDNYRGDSAKIVYFGDDTVELTEQTDSSTGVVSATWTGTQNFHSGSVVLNNDNTFTYTLNKQLTEVEVINYVLEVEGKGTNAGNTEQVQHDYAIGKIYIVPATVMYYEEDFTGLVTFEGAGWTGPVTTDGASEFQEPGVVGTTTDSIYGSDKAYLNDSLDSNGTSYHGDTTNKAVRFTYTFTGTGTTVFARTSATTGYVQFKLYKGTDTSVAYENIYYRDTYYKDKNTTDLDEDGVLYNIPIYTQEDLDYGTYTVVATVAKAGTKTAGNDNGSGKDFYLDGIRVMQPLNYDYDADLVEKAEGAYATDGEANIDTVTLRYKLINDLNMDENAEVDEECPFAVMTDIDDDVILASEYITISPKEEIYLLPGQSVSFSIKYWHQDGYQMHMGMKAPFGSAEVQVGQNTFDLNNAADCYYDITGMHSSVLEQTDDEGYSYNVATYTFKAIDSIVSLTNIKVAGNYEFFLVEDTDINIDGSEGDDGSSYSLRNPEEEEVVEEETTETPEVENTETETPVVEDTETETPVVEDTETETPVVEDTETETPVVEETETETETETPAVEETETETPVAQNTDSESDEVETTDVVETDNEA